MWYWLSLHISAGLDAVECAKQKTDECGEVQERHTPIDISQGLQQSRAPQLPLVALLRVRLGAQIIHLIAAWEVAQAP